VLYYMDLFDLLSRMTKDVKSPDFQLTFSTFFLAITWGLVLVWIFHSVLCSGFDSFFVIL
jgi:hypothetical protein